MGGLGTQQSDDQTYLERDFREQIERSLLVFCKYAAVLRRALPIWQEWMTLIRKPFSTAGVPATRSKLLLSSSEAK